MKYAFVALVIIALGACSSPKSVSKADFESVKSTSQHQNGIFYHLPATVIKIEVTAKKTIEKRGPYYRYSQRYLNLSDIIKEDYAGWEIEDARISTAGIPDSNRMFRITSEGTPAGAAVSLTPDGTIKGINISDDECDSQKEKEDTTTKPKKLEDISFDDIPFSEEQLIKTSSAATAEEVANEIYRLRDARRRLLESDMQKLPPDNGAYQKILTEIDKMEKQYLSLFKGKRETETIKKTFTFYPKSSEPTNEVLFRFSSQKGFTEISDMTGTPVYIDLRAENTAENRNIQTPDIEKERSGLIYCRPAKATVKVVDRTLLLNEQEVLIGQFGSLHQMSPSLLDSPDISVKLDSATGAILEIKTKKQ